MEARKILNSQNYHFPQPSPPGPTEGVVVAPPNVPFKGEYGGGEQQLDAKIEWSPSVNKECAPSSSMKSKQDAAENKLQPSSTIDGEGQIKEPSQI